ncbi:hypothetical protein NADFUDRAFT_81618 [Nadsonia fulvescens var. elongata DSM 6958]|uniref:Uncharacterized protein n=1 Tax=Nadsonia fulvescens var. elongata DSM 6958 TaxID=857566 RepID=A0A1E3PNJ2_9ASCO|nr:hypothetical protein NADFUDRAFT_81618 [Nadsonia fulvescens var. elongata DSM 6958]
MCSNFSMAGGNRPQNGSSSRNSYHPSHQLRSHGHSYSHSYGEVYSNPTLPHTYPRKPYSIAKPHGVKPPPPFSIDGSPIYQHRRASSHGTPLQNHSGSSYIGNPYQNHSHQRMNSAYTIPSLSELAQIEFNGNRVSYGSPNETNHHNDEDDDEDEDEGWQAMTDRRNNLRSLWSGNSSS